MKSNVAMKIAANSSTEETAQWAAGIWRMVEKVQPQMLAAQRETCQACPFRNKRAMGGCITVDCPMHMLWSELLKTTKRATAAVGAVSKARYTRVA